MEMRRVTEEAKLIEDYAKQRLAELGNSAEVLVRHHPWKAMGIVAAVGVILGVLLSRRAK